MNRYENEKHLINAYNMLAIIQHYYDYKVLEIQFVLVNDKQNYIIGIYDKIDDEPFVLRPNETPMICDYDDITIPSKSFNELYDDTVEGYILYCISIGYKPIYIDIEMHSQIWEYIDYYINKITNILKEPVQKYLSFCKETGINDLLLESYQSVILPNLYEFFLDEEDNDES